MYNAQFFRTIRKILSSIRERNCLLKLEQQVSVAVNLQLWLDKRKPFILNWRDVDILIADSFLNTDLIWENQVSVFLRRLLIILIGWFDFPRTIQKLPWVKDRTRKCQVFNLLIHDRGQFIIHGFSWKDVIEILLDSNRIWVTQRNLHHLFHVLWEICWRGSNQNLLELFNS